MGNPKGLAAGDIRRIHFTQKHTCSDRSFESVYDFEVNFKYEFNYPVLVNDKHIEFRDVTFCFVRENHLDNTVTSYTGMAVLHPGEDFSRPQGRKEALNKVMVQSLDLTELEQVRFKIELACIENGVHDCK